MFGHQFHHSVMSGLGNPGFTGAHSPLEGKGRAGWGRWGWQHLPAESPMEYSGIPWHDPHLAGISGMLGDTEWGQDEAVQKTRNERARSQQNHGKGSLGLKFSG